MQLRVGPDKRRVSAITVEFDDGSVQHYVGEPSSGYLRIVRANRTVDHKFKPEQDRFDLSVHLSLSDLSKVSPGPVQPPPVVVGEVAGGSGQQPLEAAQVPTVAEGKFDARPPSDEIYKA